MVNEVGHLREHVIQGGVSERGDGSNAPLCAVVPVEKVGCLDKVGSGTEASSELDKIGFIEVSTTFELMLER